MGARWHMKVTAGEGGEVLHDGPVHSASSWSYDEGDHVLDAVDNLIAEGKVDPYNHDDLVVTMHHVNKITREVDHNPVHAHRYVLTSVVRYAVTAASSAVSHG
jgi:hypothetical protein